MRAEHMDLNMDFRRDATASFGPGSVEQGALLPYEGRTWIASARGLPPEILGAQRDGWLTPENPLLVRGPARVLPLGWRGDPGGAGVDTQEMRAFASTMQNVGMYWAGPWRDLPLTSRSADSVGSYATALRTAGATHVDCWTYSDTTGLALVWAGAEEVGTLSLALHVVPVSWVSGSHVGKPVYRIDVRWSWSDVVALRTAGNTSETAGPSG